MKLLLFLIFALTFPAQAWGGVDAEPYALEKGNCLVTNFNSVSPEELARDLYVRPWTPCDPRSIHRVEQKSDIYLLYPVPDLHHIDLVLHFWYSVTAKDQDSYAEAYSLLNGRIEALPIVDGRHAAFRMERFPEGALLFVRVVTPANHALLFKAPFQLFTKSEFKKRLLWNDFLTGLIIGCMLIVMLYNMGATLVLRIQKRFYNIAYTVAVCYWLLFINGFLDVNSITVDLWLMAMVVIISTVKIFTLDILDASKQFPAFHQFSKAYIGSLIGLFSAAFFGPSYFFVAFLGASILSHISDVGFAIVAARKGSRPAVFVIFGFAIFAASWVLTLVDSALGLTSLSIWFLPVGTILQIIVFSLAMGLKLRLSEARAVSLSTHAFDQLAKVFYPHQIALIQSGSQLEGTMPTGTSTASVIAFDIIGSSQRMEAKEIQAIRTIFAECYQAMMEGYDGTHLHARAYRIKEMGDGFLCSLGFPFAIEKGNPEEEAIKLAEKFAKIVQDVSERSGLAKPLTCAIGIASDSITGFYPGSGAREYDLHGPAIVLATRYENTRKQIFPDTADLGNIIIVQDKVFSKVSLDLQKRYRTIDLRLQSWKVRNDAEATKLHIQVCNSEVLSKAS